MSKIKNKWQQFPLYEKIFRVLGVMFSCTAIIFGILAILWNFDVINADFHFLQWALIFLGGENLCNTVYTWRKSRGAAIVALCCGIFVIIPPLLDLFCCN